MWELRVWVVSTALRWGSTLGKEAKVIKPVGSLRQQRPSQVQGVAAGEIAMIAAVLRDRAWEFNLGFLGHLLDMATEEALNIKAGNAARPEPMRSVSGRPQ